MHTIQLIVGLGNPGQQYDHTRHNVGKQFVQLLCRQQGIALVEEKRFKGSCGKMHLAGKSVRLLCPSTFMNLSGQSVQACHQFYRIAVENILVVHDDLDLPAGAVRLKSGGGHGGHKGLRDIINHLGSRDFQRLRIGIGHPGHRDDVVSWVLKPARPEEQTAIDSALHAALAELPKLLDGNFAAVMQELHKSGKLEKAE